MGFDGHTGLYAGPSIGGSSNPLANTIPCTISPDGEQDVGVDLTAVQGTWTGGTPPYSFTYAWKTGATELGTGTDYTTQSSDQGNTIVLVETCTDSVSASVSQQSSDSVMVPQPAPVNTALPVVTVSGVGTGAVLTSDGGSWQYGGAITTLWNGANPTNTGSTYTTVAGDEGQTITPAVTNTNAIGGTTVNGNSWTLLSDPALNQLSSPGPNSIRVSFTYTGSVPNTECWFYDQSNGSSPTSDSPQEDTSQNEFCASTATTTLDVYYATMQSKGDGIATISGNVISTLPTTAVSL